MNRFNSAISIFLIACLVTPSVFANESSIKDSVYKDPKQPIDKRVNDLLGRMTLEEKVAQLQSVWKGRQELETDAGVFNPAKAKEILGNGVGHLVRPSENKEIKTPNKTPAQTVAFNNALQKWLIENTRLGIPALFHDEALHGHAGFYSTSFPQAIALGSSWDPALLYEVNRVIAQETRIRGVHQVLSPIMDVARDPRWGRIEETMGEDPYLIAELGVAQVKGLQGDDGKKIPSDRVIATLKHLAGHGEPSGGLNIGPTPVGERGLKEIFLPPFEAAVRVGGVRSVMASYNEVDGIPSHSNVELLDTILRKEWGFDGTIVSDYFAIEELMQRHHLTDSLGGAAELALTAGVDVETPNVNAYGELARLVKEKKISEQLIDRSVARVLRDKFMMGVFDNPYTKVEGVDEFVGNAEHRKLAQLAAEKSIVLLKNEKELLPLNKSAIKSIAVIGPHVDETLLGGYSDIPKQTVSVLQGIKNYLGSSAIVYHEKGTILTKNHWQAFADSIAANTLSKERWHTDEVVFPTAADTKGMIEKAVAAAKKSDVALVVVGDNEATSREAWAESHLGDRTSLDLLGEQQALVDAVLATGKPTIVLLIGGRPLSITKISQTAPAILQGWYLGQETGIAVARVLFGEVNPGGKLPVSVARSVGQLPVYYNHKPTAKRGYAFDTDEPLYPFGFGLSYTQFAYSNLQLSKKEISANQTLDITLTITNTGKRAGDEVVQLYVNDPIASVTQPVKSLRGFKRVSLMPGESKKVTFTLSANQLAFYDRQMKYVVEPGQIKLMLGSSSTDIRLQGQFDIKGKTVDVSRSKVYLTPVRVQ